VSRFIRRGIFSGPRSNVQWRARRWFFNVGRWGWNEAGQWAGVRLRLDPRVEKPKKSNRPRMRGHGMIESRQSRFLERMTALGIREDDLEESFTRSSGPGGQNVNKTSTAVMLTHRPTGLRIRCESERSQAQNRARARDLLLDKIESLRRGEAAARQAESERLRRQKRKRPRSVQARVLRDKARQSAKKAHRRRDYEE
jgi:protein subunit release factor B